jgi:hypothetical protein
MLDATPESNNTGPPVSDCLQTLAAATLVMFQLFCVRYEACTTQLCLELHRMISNGRSSKNGGIHTSVTNRAYKAWFPFQLRHFGFGTTA